MKAIHVFKTDVDDHRVAGNIILFLQQHFSHCSVNFDLADCDNILRIEASPGLVKETDIQLVLAGLGYDCEPLGD